MSHAPSPPHATSHVLAIDTALNACSVAVAPVLPDGALGAMISHHHPLDRGHGDVLFPMISAVAEEAGMALRTVSRIIVTTGPGHFTGARVGLAAARAMALALDCPCVGVSTLQALLSELPGGGVAASVIDARRDEVYMLIRGDEPVLLPIDAAIKRLRGIGTGPDLTLRLIGSGAPHLAERLGAPCEGVVLDPRTLIDPHSLLGFSSADPAAYPPEPLYLRAPDATPPTPPSWTVRA